MNLQERAEKQRELKEKLEKIHQLQDVIEENGLLKIILGNTLEEELFGEEGGGDMLFPKHDLVKMIDAELLAKIKTGISDVIHNHFHEDAAEMNKEIKSLEHLMTPAY